VIAGGGVDRTIDPAGLVGFCLFGSVPEPFTFHTAIRALPAGHFLRIDTTRGAGQPEAYASIPAALSDAGRMPKDASSTVLREAVRDSIRAHLLADVEVGLFLSSGVDSGALLGLMRDCGQQKIRAITLGFEEFVASEADEVPLAAKVAAHYNAEHIVRRVNREEFDEDLPAFLAAMDQPTIDGVNTWFIAKAAREAGLKVALSGLGGDELLGGYPSFRDVPRWVATLAAAGAVPGLGLLSRRVGIWLAPRFAARNPKALALLEYGGSYPGAYLLRRAVYLPHELPELLGPDLAREGLMRLLPLSLVEAAMTPDPQHPMHRVSALESGLYMRNQLLRDADWAGMAHSVEIRTPLVDYTLLQTVAPLMGQLLGGAGKRALGLTLSSPLPSMIVEREKTGFAVPTRAWMGGSAGPNDRLTSRRWMMCILEAAGVRRLPGSEAA
jgi:asparagine synthase (glutamine-hydrolysing)